MKTIVSRGHSRPLTEIQFVEDGPQRVLLASSAHDKYPQIRDGTSGNWIGTFHGHKGAVWSIKIDKLTRTIALTASGDFTAKLWCVTTGHELRSLTHSHVVRSVDFSNDSRQFVTSSLNGKISLFQTCSVDAPPRIFSVTQNNLPDVANKIVFIDSFHVITGNKSGSMQLWDLRTSCAEPVRSLPLSGSFPVMDFDYNEELGTTLVASGNNVISVDMNKFAEFRVFAMPKTLNFREEGAVSLRKDGKVFLTGGSDLVLREMDYQTGETLYTYKGHHGPIRCARYHPLGGKMASGSEDATIRIWESRIKQE